MTDNPAVKRKKPRVFLIVLGCCCILAAVALGLYNRWDANRAAQASQQLTADLTMMLEAGDISSQVTPGVDEGLTGAEGLEEVPVATVSVANYNICGVLTIPAIKIELAVISEWSYPNLSVSACRYSGAPEGQMIILAHNYRGHFGDLAKLKLGDKVSFKDVEGNLHEYKVTGSEIWGADQLKEIISGDTWDLTLFTCTYGRANRVVIRCSKV